MKIALLCADGIGDGLLMMILHHHLKKEHQLTVFHHQHPLLSPLFHQAHFSSYPPLDSFKETFSSFDEVLLQNDHSEKAWALFNLRNSKELSNLKVLFVTPFPKEQKSGDYLFSNDYSMAGNLKNVCSHLYSIENATTDNGLHVVAAPGKKTTSLVMIHPTSKDHKRSWPKKKFIELSFFLKKLGYEPHFCVSKEEEQEWTDIPMYGIKLHVMEDLYDLASKLCHFGFFIGNDSGIGHLASNLKIPTLTISGNKKRVNRWRPDWHLNEIVTTRVPIPNFKGLVFSFFDGRLRDNYWQYFISVGKVLRGFKRLEKTHLNNLKQS